MANLLPTPGKMKGGDNEVARRETVGLVDVRYVDPPRDVDQFRFSTGLFGMAMVNVVCTRRALSKGRIVEVAADRHNFAWSGKMSFSGVLRCIYCRHTASCFLPPLSSSPSPPSFGTAALSAHFLPAAG
jgi:hypothetical protein